MVWFFFPAGEPTPLSTGVKVQRKGIPFFMVMMNSLEAFELGLMSTNSLYAHYRGWGGRGAGHVHTWQGTGMDFGESLPDW